MLTESNRVGDCLRLWAECNKDFEFCERLQQACHLCQTTCGMRLCDANPSYVELENSEFLHEVAMCEDTMVYGTDPVQLASLHGDLLEILQVDRPFTFVVSPFAVRISCDFILVLGIRYTHPEMELWDRHTGIFIRKIRASSKWQISGNFWFRNRGIPR